jgi:hypothetical protein
MEWLASVAWNRGQPPSPRNDSEKATKEIRTRPPVSARRQDIPVSLGISKKQYTCETSPLVSRRLGLWKGKGLERPRWSLLNHSRVTRTNWAHSLIRYARRTNDQFQSETLLVQLFFQPIHLLSNNRPRFRKHLPPPFSPFQQRDLSTKTHIHMFPVDVSAKQL